MKAVVGYLSEDGNFFVSQHEATQHDAEMQIRAWCVTHTTDPDKVIFIIEALADSILEYVHASRQIELTSGNEEEAGHDEQDSGSADQPHTGKHPTVE